MLAHCHIHPGADRDEAQHLVERVAKRLGIPAPDIHLDGDVWFRAPAADVREALDAMDPEWTRLVAAPSPQP